jgi:hypothetical protein
MQLVIVYLVGAVIAAAVAYYSGPQTPVAAYWLYVIGAVLFALAAIGQYMKITKAKS